MHKKVIVKFFQVFRHQDTDQSADDTFTTILADMSASAQMEREIGDDCFIKMDARR